MHSHLTPRGPTATTELPGLGPLLRTLRLQRGIGVADAAADLRMHPKDLRALEWDRPDLVSRDAGALQRRYAVYLGLEASEDAAPARRFTQAAWIPVLTVLAGPIVILYMAVDGDATGAGSRVLISLGLVLLSSLLLAGSVLPPGVVARTRLSPFEYAQYRQPLVLAAIGILVPVAVFTLLIRI